MDQFYGAGRGDLEQIIEDGVDVVITRLVFKIGLLDLDISLFLS